MTDAQKIAFTCIVVANAQAEKASQYLQFVKDPPPTPKRKPR